jgi:DNA-binding Lrp family transcriptional regulator
MSAAGRSQSQIARTLNVAYADGLLSEDTFLRRVDELLKAGLVDPDGLVGDLNLRTPRGAWLANATRAIGRVAARVTSLSAPRPSCPPALLALDWSGARSEILIGRHYDCDVVLADLAVSRRHARLVFRDEKWILQDLHSTNGTTVNDVPVGRCELRPGDLIAIGANRLTID